MEHGFLGHPSGKFPGATGNLKKYSCCSRRIVPNGNSCYIYVFNGSSLMPVSAFLGRFSVNRTDLCKCKRDFGTTRDSSSDCYY